MKDITLYLTFTIFSSTEEVDWESHSFLHLHPITADNGADPCHEQGRDAISCNINLWVHADVCVCIRDDSTGTHLKHDPNGSTQSCICSPVTIHVHEDALADCKVCGRGLQ